LNNREVRRLLTVVMPAAFALAACALVVWLTLDDSGSGGGGPPRVGDHWHANYEYYVCGRLQPNAPEWNSGVHTHGDGVIHIHPVESFEEGSGARLVKWFEYGGGELTEDTVRLPGERTTHTNGDECPGGVTAIVQVYVIPAGTDAQERLEDWSDYIPQDGDTVGIFFGPEP
jgi:hypothetical protein